MKIEDQNKNIFVFLTYVRYGLRKYLYCGSHNNGLFICFKSLLNFEFISHAFHMFKLLLLTSILDM